MRRKPVPRRPGVALALRRHPRARAGLVTLAGLLSGTAVAAEVQQSEDARNAWGRSVPVVVATRDVPAGDVLDGGNTEIVARPGPLVPAGALTEVPTGGRLALPVFEGEAVTQPRMAPAGLSAVAARLDGDTVGMAVPVEPGTTPPLSVGDRVDVLVALATEVAGDGPPGFALATHLEVVDVTPTAVTIAVPRDVAPRLAVAFGQGAVTVALVGA